MFNGFNAGDFNGFNSEKRGAIEIGHPTSI
jgi:hypothetical protein